MARKSLGKHYRAGVRWWDPIVLFPDGTAP